MSALHDGYRAGHIEGYDEGWMAGWLARGAELVAVVTAESKDFTPAERAGVRKALAAQLRELDQRERGAQ